MSVFYHVNFMFLQGKICVSARIDKLFTKSLFDPDHSIRQQNALCLTKKLFIKVSLVRRSHLVIFYFKEKFCVSHVSESLLRDVYCLKHFEDLVEKVTSPVILDTNRSFKQ